MRKTSAAPDPCPSTRWTSQSGRDRSNGCGEVLLDVGLQLGVGLGGSSLAGEGCSAHVPREVEVRVVLPAGSGRGHVGTDGPLAEDGVRLEDPRCASTVEDTVPVGHRLEQHDRHDDHEVGRAVHVEPEDVGRAHPAGRRGTYDRRQSRQGVPVDAVRRPVVERAGAVRAVEVDRGGVPVQHRPLEPGPAALDADAARARASRAVPRPWPRCSGSTKRSSSQMPGRPVHVEKLRNQIAMPTTAPSDPREARMPSGSPWAGKRASRNWLGRRLGGVRLPLVVGQLLHEADQVGDVARARPARIVEVAHARRSSPGRDAAVRRGPALWVRPT